MNVDYMSKYEQKNIKVLARSKKKKKNYFCQSNWRFSAFDKWN